MPTLDENIRADLDVTMWEISTIQDVARSVHFHFYKEQMRSVYSTYTNIYVYICTYTHVYICMLRETG